MFNFVLFLHCLEQKVHLIEEVLTHQIVSKKLALNLIFYFLIHFMFPALITFQALHIGSLIFHT